jgi:3-oxoadipate enol-lactonase
MSGIDGRERALATLTLSLSDASAAGQALSAALAAGASPAEADAVVAVAERASGLTCPPAVRADLDARLLGPWTDVRDVTVGDLTTVVAHRAGTGVPLVLCHSLGTDHHMWEPLVAALPPTVEVWAWDARNHGRHRDHVLDFSVPIVADDAAAMFDTLGIDKAFLVGISMGGSVVQEFAIRYQHRLAALAIMATRGKGAATGEQRASAGERDGLAAQVAVTLSRWFTPGYLAVNDRHVRHIRELVLSWSVDAWGRGWRALGSTSTASRLHDVRVPTICVAGEVDSSSPPPVLQGLVDVLPDARLEVVRGGPHLFPIENPEATAELLMRHWRAVADSNARSS